MANILLILCLIVVIYSIVLFRRKEKKKGVIVVIIGFLIGLAGSSLMPKEDKIDVGAELQKTVAAGTDKSKEWYKEEKDAKEKAKQADKDAKEKAKQENKDAKEKANIKASESEKTSTPVEFNDADKEIYSKDISYDNIARTPDKFVGQFLTISGEIIQVIKGSLANNYRLAVDGDYSKIVLLEVSNAIVEDNRILENDNITVYGMSYGETTYKSALGGDVTVPTVLVDFFEIK